MSRQFFYICDGNAQSFFTDRADKLSEWLSELRAVVPGPDK
jgi:hypothetical protein